MEEQACTALPELPIPDDIPNEALAYLSEHGSRPIWAEGSATGRVIVILDNPGARENREGVPFVCGTRQTLRAATRDAGLHDEDLYVTFLLKRRPRRAYNREQAWNFYLPLLHRQIEDQKPCILICMGNTVVKAMLGQSHEVKNLRGSQMMYQGVPAIVTYHPLAARRRPGLYPLVVSDLSQAARLIV